MDELPHIAPHTLRWDVDSLWEQLGAVLPGMSIEVHARVESTNTMLIERARKLAGRLDAPVSTPGDLDRGAGRGGERGSERATDRGPYGRRAVDTHPSLLVAEHQTLGRGRMGRDWLAQPGRSLTLSLGLPMQPRHWGGLSLAVGVALADALDPLNGPLSQPKIGLKWPNDLWLIDPTAANGVGRKLGGVLIETVPVGAQRMVVVGVGLNILPRTGPAADDAESPAPRPLASGYASLSELHADATAPGTLHQVALPLARALQAFESSGLQSFMASFAQRDVLAGRRISLLRPPASAGSAPVQTDATAVGISAHGALLVREPAAGGGEQTTEIHSGEVSVRVDDSGLGAGHGRLLVD